MLAIARELRLKNTEASVNKFIDSPVLCLRKDNRVIKQLTFVDSVLQYGELLSPEDISKARRVAGTTFVGQLEQFFLVIGETGNIPQIPTPNGTFHQQSFDLNRTNGRGRGRGQAQRGRSGRGRGRGQPGRGSFGSNFEQIGLRKTSTSDLKINETNQLPLSQQSVLYSQVAGTQPNNALINPINTANVQLQPNYVTLPQLTNHQ